MSKVELNQIVKTFPDGTTALDQINLKVKDRELLVILGPSGCGKSTLLRVVAGLEKTTHGRVFINEEDVTEHEPGSRDIAMVFQNYALYPHMTVYKNIAYGLKNRNISRNEIASRVKEVAESLQINDYLDRKPSQLSGGQRQRVAMGRAIARNPKVFLFDEPLSNLDAKLRVQVRLEISRLQSELGVTSLYVTHDQVEAMTLGHRLVLMNEGRIEQIGEPLDIYEKPNTLFVAGFIGSPPMNLLPGEMNEKGEFTLGTVVKIQLKDYQNHSEKIIFGIRPEHFLIDGSGSMLGNFIVEYFERQGADNYLYGKMEGYSTQMTIRVKGDETHSIGSVLKLSYEKNKVHFFDCETGLRVNP
jgi:sn-glycerol 3-phosphate transport system ATP-binding protein